VIARLRFELRGLRLAFVLAWHSWRADAADRHARDCHEIADGADAWADLCVDRAERADRAYRDHELRRGIE
jgi:hypothetical protein